MDSEERLNRCGTDHPRSLISSPDCSALIDAGSLLFLAQEI